MNTISLSLDEIYQLANKTLLANGCDEDNANILSDTIMRAERDGSLSHGLFRLPAYVVSLKSKKVNGKARPEVKKISSSVIKVSGNSAFAPMVLKVGLPELIKLAKETGLLVGISSGANVLASERWIKQNDPAGVVITMLCDRGERYMSILNKEREDE